MSIPVAVSPAVKVPGVYMMVNLIGGPASPGTGTLRVALLCPKAPSGDMTVDTEVRLGAGEESAKLAFGIGGFGALAAKIIYDVFPEATIDFVAPTAGTGDATQNITAAGTPTSDTVVDCDYAGREFEVPWNAGETADEFKASLIAAVSSRSGILPLSAASGGTGVASLTSKVAGNIGNDIKIYMKIRSQTGTETINGVTEVDLNLAGGTTDPDFTTALSSIEGREYHFILMCLSNTDIANIATANNLSKVYTHCNLLNTGLNAKLQQFIAGFTGTGSQAIASTAHSNSANNAEFGELALFLNSRDLPCEVGARELAGRLYAVSRDASSNRIGELMSGLSGARDKITDNPDSQANSLLSNGVTVISYTAQDSPVLMRAVTTHSKDAVGGEDDRLLDTQNVDGTYIVSRDIRDALPQAFPQAKVTEDVFVGEDPPPKGVTEIRDIKAWVISRLRVWQREGVVQKTALDQAIADGSLIVQLNASDQTQVDYFLPHKIVQPLAKHSVVVSRIPN